MDVNVKVRRLPDGTFEAVTPDVPGCVTRGRSRKEVLDKHREAVRPYVVASCDTMPDCIDLHVMEEAAAGRGAQAAGGG